MKILFLDGALRRGGTTEGSVNYCMDYIKENYPDIETEVVFLSEEEIINCDSCYHCDKRMQCDKEDDVKKIIQKMLLSDVIIYCFPVCAFGLSSVMQRFLERAGVGYLRFERPLKNKYAAAIITGRRYSHELAWGQISLNIMLNKMILLGSGFCPFIRNDGKELGMQIEDEEGLTALREMIDRFSEYEKEQKR